MNDLLERWIAALRSGEYAQTTSILCNDQGGYCCLGVLQMVAEGEVERFPDTTARALPSDAFLVRHGSKRMNLFGTGIDMWELVHMNDDGCTFNDIADKLEAGRG